MPFRTQGGDTALPLITTQSGHIMTDEANGAFDAEDDTTFTEEEQAILRGEEPEGDEQAAEGAEQPADGEEHADGVEQAEPAQAQPEAERERQKTVPHQALHEERERRRALEQQYRQAETERARYEERLNILLQWAQSQNDAAQQANQPAPPDQNEDPIGYLNWNIQQQQQQLQEYDQRFQQLSQSQQQQQQMAQQQQLRQQLWDAYSSDSAQFAAEQPDFNDAANYLQQVRAMELQAMGFDNNQIQQQINADFEGFVAAAFQNQRRPAESLYALAKARGFNPNATAQQQQQAAAANATGAAGQQQPTQQQPGKKLQNIAKGQAANKSLSGSGSGSPQPLDAATIAGMDDEEFGSWYQQNFSEKKLEKMLGY